LIIEEILASNALLDEIPGVWIFFSFEDLGGGLYI